MKAIFSNWHKPQHDNVHAGYNNLEDFKIGISTAILCASRFYECHFVGDPYSCDIVRELRLPIKSIQPVVFGKYAPDGLWNYSKLKACSMFEAPFVHIDNDVFLLKKLPEFKDYLFQNVEDFKIHPWYYEPISLMKNLTINKSIFKPEIKAAYNCGIIGISNNNLKQEWIIPSLELIESDDFKNLYRQKGHKILFEIIVEQFTAISSVRHYKRHVHFLLRHDHIQEDAKAKGYVHMISKSKRNPNRMEKIRKFYNRNFKQL